MIDKETGQTVSIFKPHQHKWSEHFIWSGDGLRIIPLTSVGRVTVDLLEFNREQIQDIRAADVTVNRHPPEEDLIKPIE